MGQSMSRQERPALLLRKMPLSAPAKMVCESTNHYLGASDRLGQIVKRVDDNIRAPLQVMTKCHGTAVRGDVFQSLIENRLEP